jgi:predicted nucleotidyltransferase
VLENILSSKSKIAILRALIANPAREYTIEEIARMTKISLGTVFPALRGMVETRIILSRKVGRSQLYYINEQHMLFGEIKALFNKEVTVPLDIAKDFVSILCKTNIRNIVLFGSSARGEFNEHSDIDILVVYTRKKPENIVEGAIDILLKKYDANLVPIFLSVDEVKERLKKLDPFIVTVLSEGKILHGDKKWLEL